MKKAGTFFKSVMSKGKSLFKQEEVKAAGDNGYGSDEDTDIIEIGKGRMPGLASHH
jgi:hypothetical protein